MGGAQTPPPPAPLAIIPDASVHLKIKIAVTVRRSISKRSHEKIGDCEQFRNYKEGTDPDQSLVTQYQTSLLCRWPSIYLALVRLKDIEKLIEALSLIANNYYYYVLSINQRPSKNEINVLRT